MHVLGAYSQNCTLWPSRRGPHRQTHGRRADPHACPVSSRRTGNTLPTRGLRPALATFRERFWGGRGPAPDPAACPCGPRIAAGDSGTLAASADAGRNDMPMLCPWASANAPLDAYCGGRGYLSLFCFLPIRFLR